MYMCVAFMGTDYFLKHSQNTQMLCYAKQCCFPNKLYFMSKRAEQGSGQGLSVREQWALVSLSVTSSLQLFCRAPEHSPGFLWHNKHD